MQLALQKKISNAKPQKNERTDKIVDIRAKSFKSTSSKVFNNLKRTSAESGAKNVPIVMNGSTDKVILVGSEDLDLHGKRVDDATGSLSGDMLDWGVKFL